MTSGKSLRFFLKRNLHSLWWHHKDIAPTQCMREISALSPPYHLHPPGLFGSPGEKSPTKFSIVKNLLRIDSSNAKRHNRISLLSAHRRECGYKMDSSETVFTFFVWFGLWFVLLLLCGMVYWEYCFALALSQSLNSHHMMKLILCNVSANSFFLLGLNASNTILSYTAKRANKNSQKEWSEWRKANFHPYKTNDACW